MPRFAHLPTRAAVAVAALITPALVTAFAANAASTGTLNGHAYAPNGAALARVDVVAYDVKTHYMYSGYTDSAGHYRISVPASRNGYEICFDGSVSSGGPSKAGYLPRCYRNTPWKGFDGAGDPYLAPRLTPVKVGAGQNVTSVNQTLPMAAGFTGRILNGSGHPLPAGTQGWATVFKPNGAAGTYGLNTYGANKNGVFKITGLAPSTTGYIVCLAAMNNANNHHYHAQCYQNAAYGGYDGSPIPKAAKIMPVTAGTLRAGVNADLRY